MQTSSLGGSSVTALSWHWLKGDAGKCNPYGGTIKLSTEHIHSPISTQDSSKTINSVGASPVATAVVSCIEDSSRDQGDQDRLLPSGGPAGFDMRILCHVIFLVMLGGIFCQNNRSAKPSGKPAKKASSTQTAEVAQHAPDEDLYPVPGAAASSSKDTIPAARGGTQQGASATKPAEDMKLHFLRNTPAMCNDGTTAGFYLKEFKGSKRWLIFLEGGWCCYNKETCDSRYKNIPRLMSSADWPQTRKGSGILSAQADENPHWYNANIVFVPYCSSDVWSGNKPAAKAKQGKETEYSFMGSVIIREMIKDLASKGLKQAKVVMLAGTSAGGTGVLLNIEKVASQLEQLGADTQVRGLVDSGWFLESKQQKAPDCPDSISCSPVDAIKKGIRLWNGVIPEKCKQHYKRGEEWQCFFGHKLYSFLSSPLFVVQWLFDEEQLRVENIYMGGQSLSEQQWTYMQNLGKELKNSLKDVTAVFAPSCLSHTLITRSNWMEFQVKGTSLSRALQCWDRSLQEASKNSKTALKGCPFHLIDSCQWPQCNPTCPVLIDQATQQEMTLLQVLASMGLDLQKLGIDARRDSSTSTGMISNGG
ncbi:carboxylesterase notum2 isoform X2 [Pygocentrus nattereri]|uniref:Notum, palmitoleoyl-protein carboxylesterase n=1 Tax=Pygocentrus nattereri TaxID=42514 RepID=A0A3B4DWP5_PYGNA|nr:carboxylesterase notum2 isoform X2 [Pygocentrus nattereri]XP_037392228.1 carboxylesterase notum2 isoform X2 [Pygocentrus nattereri]